MNPAKFEQARRVFEAASSLSEVESRELVMKQCAADAELSEIVVDLLKQARRQLAEQVERAKRSNERGSSIIGARVGPYVVQSLIGQGGMGAVYEALHERTRQTVALKLLLAAVATPERLRRFEFEQQVLARLEHPGIARILHADTADLGGGVQPYFAMELVRGESLIDYSRSHNLTILQRLNLIVRVADALHYAHQRGVIHRDLKPSNIVVNECGEPKILDFGIARLSADGARSAIVSTQIGQLVGTLPYMSPEQASGDADLVDVRSDIYSLGVVAYELLSDRLPLDVRRLWIADAVQKIREEEPPRLGGISRAFRGDIDTIVRKALAKNKEHRYASANEFAADIRRHLNHEPITARRPTLGYQGDR
ncbi:MAG: serine/threonine protein kinase, partial [Phycisphaerales bacterium]|nr:serine/threonine protein kinase [Phycisphaerales bacterium]